jgi:hypothetical protein
MHELIEAASQALILNDAETLERLEIQACSHLRLSDHELDRTQHAAAVLSAQVDAIAAHLALRSRVMEAQEAAPWQR